VFEKQINDFFDVLPYKTSNFDGISIINEVFKKNKLVLKIIKELTMQI
jgi:hypothetical protein